MKKFFYLLSVAMFLYAGTAEAQQCANGSCRVPTVVRKGTPPRAYAGPQASPKQGLQRSQPVRRAAKALRNRRPVKRAVGGFARLVCRGCR